MLKEALLEILKTQELPPVAPHEVGWVESIAVFRLKKLISANHAWMRDDRK
jgi:beta-lactamase regulating signal transducer with metallopeptidase domain